MPSYSTAISRVIIDYMVNYMKPLSPSINLFQVSHPNNTQDQLSIINEILYESNRKDVVHRVIMDKKFLPIFSRLFPTRKRFNNIFFIDTCDSFNQIFSKVNFESWDFQGNYIIAITRYNDGIYSCMMKVFEAFWSKHIVNVVVIFMSQAKNEVLLYTYYPFSAFYCERAVPVQLNQYRGNNYLNKIDYFPEKLNNFYGCPLSVATFNNPPFITYKQDNNGAVHVDGIEGVLIRVLTQRLNFNIQLYISPDAWGYVYRNGSASGAMQLVKEEKVNLTIGFFASLPPRDNIMKASYVYFTTNLVWIVPPGSPQSALKKLINPMDPMIWTLFTISLTIGILIIAYLKLQSKGIQSFVFGMGIKSPGLNFINIILGNSLIRLPNRNFSRFLFIIFTFYCFILRSCYLGGLVKFMQLDTRETKMETTKEIIDRGYTFYMLHSALAYLDELPAVQSQTKLISYDDFNKGLETINNSLLEGVYLTSIAHLAYRNMKAYPNYFNYAPESIYTLNIVMYMQRDSCFKQNFDTVIINLVSSGLINKWASTWIDRKYLKEPIIQNLQTLSVKQLEGAFQLLIGGLMLALIAFCVEISFEKFKKRGKFISRMNK